jgi:hypothetical protein
MPISELDQARALFESVERESDPERKLAHLEEALDLIDDFTADHEAPSAEINYAINLRHAHLRRLLAQLIKERDVQVDVWFNYVKLLLLRVAPEIDDILAEDASLKSGYLKFVNLWAAEFLEAAARIK